MNRTTSIQSRMNLAAVLLLAVAGCSRGQYRQKADAEVYELVAQKANHPHWPLHGYTIDVDPRSRMFSPFSADHPPMPPDDPSSHALLHRIDGKPGYPCWHKDGDTPYVENPLWMAYLPMTEENGQKFLLLDAGNSVRMALMHASTYQSQLETLYLSALDVSFERFRFDSQFFGGYAVDFKADGPDRGDDGESSSTLAGVGFNESPRGSGDLATMEKLGVTGTTLIVNLANELMWEFSGSNNYTGSTLLDFALVQPLLRGAGRRVAMHGLTIAERALLANVRQMERYRRGFYVQVVTGEGPGEGPSRQVGIFVNESGVQERAVVGGAGFGRLGDVGQVFGGTGAGDAGGFLGLLQDSQRIVNQEINVAQLRSSLAQFEAMYTAERIDFLQVLQSRQALLDAQSRLLNSKATYEAKLDDFKLQLGLPPNLPVRIDDGMIDELKLLDPQSIPQQNDLSDIEQKVGSTITQILDRIELHEHWLYKGLGIEFEFDSQLQAELQTILLDLDKAELVRQAVLRVNISRAQADIKKLKEKLPIRTEQLRDLQERITSFKRFIERVDTASYATIGGDIDLKMLNAADLQALPDALQKRLDTVRRELERIKPAIEKHQAQIRALLAEGKDLKAKILADRLKSEVTSAAPAQLGKLSSLLLEFTLLQAEARTEAISLKPVNLDERTAVDIARRYRRDWMNIRAALVDAWRLVGFHANGLESNVAIVFEGDISNFGQNPLDLQGTTGRLRARIQFDAPITRLIERNTYRRALIDYGQARRRYYTAEDQIVRGLRTILRTIELNQLNLEVRRQAILIAIRNVELARLRLQEPPRPGQQGQPAQRPTIARDLVDALSGLQNAQNDFLSIWITYEVLRRSLDFNLGTMQLTPDGLWDEPKELTAKYLLDELEIGDF
ncbi:MAG: hypothetical protein IH991_08070, partial [Planctomycetes bacterium]|nr:hypothetical protein [Planctomycetota bacterium]